MVDYVSFKGFFVWQPYKFRLVHFCFSLVVKRSNVLNVFNSDSCSPCNCNVAGRLTSKCNERGECQCKDNVEGDKCDRCKNGTVNLQQNNKYGCSGGMYIIGNRTSIVIRNLPRHRNLGF